MIELPIAVSVFSSIAAATFGMLLIGERARYKRKAREFDQLSKSETKAKENAASLLCEIDKLRGRLNRIDEIEASHARQYTELQKELEVFARRLEESSAATFIAQKFSSELKLELASTKAQVEQEVAKSESLAEELGRVLTLDKERAQINAQLEQRLLDNRVFIDALKSELAEKRLELTKRLLRMHLL